MTFSVHTGRILVVTRLGVGKVCHVGYVDARANAKANELAREIADKHARNFDCENSKRIVLGEKRPDAEYTFPKDE
jgi:hypothetical protein